MKTSLLFFVCAVFLVAFSNSSSCCDYAVASIDDLSRVLSGQQDWTFVPVLCFWPGYYNFSQTPFYLTASQKWIGPQKGIDSACGRVVSPPCARLTSASSLNSTAEAILNLSGTPILVAINHDYDVNFTIDGFTVYQPSFGPPIVQQSDGVVNIYIYNSYVYNTQVVSTYVEINSSYISTPLPGQSFLEALVSFAFITNSYFYKISATNTGTTNVTAVGNTFAFSNTAFYVLGSSYFENNIFLYSQLESVVDISGESTFLRNLFYLTSTGVYFPSTGPATIDFVQNCFIENTVSAVNLGYVNATNSSTFLNNYFGYKAGPSINFQTTPAVHSGSVFFPYIRSNILESFPFSYSNTPLKSFTAPNLCPRPPISIQVNPSSLNFNPSGVTIQVNYSLYLDPLLISAGLDISFFDGMQAVFYLFDQNGVVTNNFEPLTDYISFYPSVTPTGGFNVTIDLANLPQSQSPNYYIVARFLVGPTNYPTYNPYFWTSITINWNPPAVCSNPPQITVQKIQRFDGPLHFNLDNLYCPVTDWVEVGVLDSPVFSFNQSTQDVQLVIPSNASGTYKLSYLVAPQSRPLPVQTLSVTFIIQNHNPVIVNSNYTYTSPFTQLPAWNIIANSTDQDLDTLTVLQIQRTKGASPTNVIQLDSLTLYFVSQQVIVRVSSNGNIQLYQPNTTTNPVSIGGSLPGTWKQSISFQIQITDGDIVNQNVWGIVNISSSN